MSCSVDLRKTYLKFPNSPLEEILNIAFFEAKIEQDEIERILKNDERNIKN